MLIEKTSKQEKKHDSPVGTNVIIHNTRNFTKARWDKTGTLVETLPF